jgi:hypothetical protein
MSTVPTFQTHITFEPRQSRRSYNCTSFHYRFAKGVAFYISRSEPLTFFYLKHPSHFSTHDDSTPKQPWDSLAPSHTAISCRTEKGRMGTRIDSSSSLVWELQKIMKSNKETATCQAGVSNACTVFNNIRTAVPRIYWKPVGIFLSFKVGCWIVS